MLPKCADIYQCRLSGCYWCLFCPDTNPAEYTAQRHDTSDVMYPCTIKYFTELIYFQDNNARNHVRVCVFPQRLNFHSSLKKGYFVQSTLERMTRKILMCGNKMPTRCNRGFYCRSYCLLNMFRAPLCPSSGAQECYTVLAACGILCCGFFK